MSIPIDENEAFSDFLDNYGKTTNPGGPKYELAISELAVKRGKSLVLDFNDLYDFNDELALNIISEPERYLFNYGIAAFSKLKMRDPEYATSIKKMSLRIRGLPDSTNLRMLGSEHIGRLISVTGIVLRASEMRPFVIDAVFTCGACGDSFHLIQISPQLKTPKKCGSCQSRRDFTLNVKESEFIDSQFITIQERPEELPPGQTPRRIDILLLDDLVHSVNPGDIVQLTGTIVLNPIIKRSGAQRSFDITLHGNHVEANPQGLQIVEITKEDEKEILELSKDPYLRNKLIYSIAPSCFGYESIKEAILLLLLGGERKVLPDVTIRGDINVFLVGDPGTYKSQFLNYTARAAPRAVETTGRGSTAAGLTSAVVKDKNGRWSLEAGALVLADGGVCCIDEMDKMREDDRGAIHPVMEQQVVHSTKAGIIATMNARASILAAANPALGRWDPNQTITGNLSAFTIPLLTRFDLIFIVRDVPNPEIDSKIADRILNIHEGSDLPVVPIAPEKLRKYIAYSKRECHPRINSVSRKRLKEHYLAMRATFGEASGSSISITARQLETLVRLAEANARLYLRDDVTDEDSMFAVALMKRSLEEVCIDPATAEIDIDILYSGKPRSLQEKLSKALGLIGEMQGVSGVVKDEDLFDGLKGKYGISRVEAARLIGVLMRDGTIYSPRPGSYKCTSSPSLRVKPKEPDVKEKKVLREELDRVFELVFAWKDGLHTDKVASELEIEHNEALKLLLILLEEGMINHPDGKENWWKA